MDDLPDFLDQLDRAGIAAFFVEDGRCRSVNNSFCILFQIESAGKAIGARMTDFLPDTSSSQNLTSFCTQPSPVSERPFRLEIQFASIAGRTGAYLGVIKHPSINLLKKRTMPAGAASPEFSSSSSGDSFGPCAMEGFEDLAAWIKRESDLNLDYYKSRTVVRRIEKRLLETGCKNCHDYLNLLKNSAGEKRNLTEYLTVGFTEFFRDVKVFGFLKERIFPEIINGRKCAGSECNGRDARKDDIRIWSAGTASGEEAYSVAALALGASSGTSLLPVVFATDVSENKINIARKGVYSSEKSWGIPAEMRNLYFSSTSKLSFKVSDAIRRLCVFGRHNLIADPPYGNMDLVLCRNVMIYFTPKLQEQITANLMWSLIPGGYLVLGSSESLPGSAMGKFEVVESELHIYRKRR
ncbi:MAG: protein-glutamate O-methyltransferase CheR [Pseudomonadota bacterium]